MKISSRCEYACRAMLELGGHARTEQTMTAQEIAERRAIPEKYLVQILLQLKRAGLVRSVRGAQGGYRLAEAPEKVSMLDIIQAIDGPIADQVPGRETTPEFQAVWGSVARAIQAELGAATLRHLLDVADAREMYYI
jgi:Rrf2 family transcriptional regulator, cysteine metabolism repressor